MPLAPPESRSSVPGPTRSPSRSQATSRRRWRCSATEHGQRFDLRIRRGHPAADRTGVRRGRRGRRAHAEKPLSAAAVYAADPRRWHTGKREHFSHNRKAWLIHDRSDVHDDNDREPHARPPARAGRRAVHLAHRTTPRPLAGGSSPDRGELHRRRVRQGRRGPRRSSTPRRWSVRSSAASRAARQDRPVSCPSGVHQKKGLVFSCTATVKRATRSSSSPRTTAPGACATRRADGGAGAKPWRRRPSGALALVAAAATLAPPRPPAAQARTAPVAGRSQELAVLLTPHGVESAAQPPDEAHDAARVGADHGRATVLPVVGHATRQGVRWLRVMLPGRPNGSSGWIARRARRRRRRLAHRPADLDAQGSRLSPGEPHADIHGRRRQAVDPHAARALLRRGEHPHAARQRRRAVRLATSARSNVLQEFEGGPGQIALHGVQNLGGTPGTAVSHGCVRLADPAIRWLAARISPGVPVTITD